MLINDLEYYDRFAHRMDTRCSLDEPESSRNTAEAWHNYPVQNFDYRFNSWAFRGPEYEQYIGQPVNICLGDSFTVNIGGPIEHSWCDQLAQNFPIPTLNLGMSGSGNDSISMLYYRACDLFDVQFTFVMYTYFHRRLKDKQFIVVAEEDTVNFDYFQMHRIPNAIECTLPGWCLSKTESEFLKNENIHYFDAPYITNFTKDSDRKYIDESYYNKLAGPDWPSLTDFINGAEAHPDMYTDNFGKFVGYQMHTNRDGWHCNYNANKNYANYFYQQWSKHES